MVAWWDVSEYELLQRDAREQFRIGGAEQAEPIPVFGFEGSIEAADRDAARWESAHAVDLYDLNSDGEPF